jgi:O-antigen/teichoic acid export membrane protein
MREFIQNFIKAKGIWLTAANLLSKLVSLALSLWMANQLSAEAFGQVSKMLNYTAFFTAFTGLGLLHAELKYASQTPNAQAQQQIFDYSFYYGLLGQLGINIIMIGLALALYPENNTLILLCFALRLALIFVAEHAKNIARSSFDNQTYAWIDISQAMAALLLAFALSFWQPYWAYVLALSVSPLSVFFFFKPSAAWWRSLKPNLDGIKLKTFWSFGLKTAITVQVCEWLLLLDLFYIGHYLGDAQVAHYRLASILPFNFMVIGQIVMQTFFPKLCAEHQNPTYHRQFIKKYTALMLLLSGILLGLSWLFETYILAILHLPEAYVGLYWWSMLACVAAYLLRIPYGFLLSALGKNHWNLLAAILALLLALLAYPLCLPWGDLATAAIINLSAIVFTGLFTAVAYFYELRKLKKSI